MAKSLVGIILSLILLVFSKVLLYAPPSTQFNKQFIGVINPKRFYKKLSKRFKLEKMIRKIKIRKPVGTKIKVKTYVYEEYVNLKDSKSRLLVWFQKNPTQPVGDLLKTICILSSNKKKVLEVAHYFIQAVRIGKAYKKRWQKNLDSVTFKLNREIFREYGSIPTIRCITQRSFIKNNKSIAKNVLYYIEVNILG